MLNAAEAKGIAVVTNGCGSQAFIIISGEGSIGPPRGTAHVVTGALVLTCCVE